MEIKYHDRMIVKKLLICLDKLVGFTSIKSGKATIHTYDLTKAMRAIKGMHEASNNS